eukprot:5464451-Prymnesium_polylepis.1
MLRNNAWSRRFVEHVWTTNPRPGPIYWPEQAVIAFLLGGSHPRCRRSVTVNGCCDVPAPLRSETDDAAGTAEVAVNATSSRHPGHLDPHVDFRQQKEMHAYPSAFRAGQDLIIHFARGQARADPCCDRSRLRPTAGVTHLRECLLALSTVRHSLTSLLGAWTSLAAGRGHGSREALMERFGTLLLKNESTPA